MGLNVEHQHGFITPLGSCDHSLEAVFEDARPRIVDHSSAQTVIGANDVLDRHIKSEPGGAVLDSDIRAA